MSLLDREPLSERPEDQKFLLGIPDDLEPACLRVQDEIKSRMNNPHFITMEVVVAVKTALSLPIEPHDEGATRVIINVLRETMEECGFVSPELIFQKLGGRKQALRASMTKK